MNRRKLLATVGIAGSSVAFGVGTGAFTSAQADRDVTVEVADDSTGYLEIVSTSQPNGNFAVQSGGEFGLDFTSSNSTTPGGQGLNQTGVSSFASVFDVRNAGTQDVELVLRPGSNSVGTAIAPTGLSQNAIITIVPQGAPAGQPVTLSPGTAQRFGVVATVGSSVSPPSGIQQDTITFDAEAP
jgi:hypothetical protein